MKLTTDERAALQGAMNVLAEILQQSSDEVPDRVREWPTNDEHLRGEVWEDTDGDIYRFSDGWWGIWEPGTRRWVEVLRLEHLDNTWAPFTRTTDPSLPRTWDTLEDVPEDVERVTGDYVGMHREFARSGVCESGWFLRAKVGPFSGWVELLVGRAEYVTNIKEDQ